MIEFTVTFPNWGTGLIVACGVIFLNATALIAAYNIGRTSKEKN